MSDTPPTPPDTREPDSMMDEDRSSLPWTWWVIAIIGLCVLLYFGIINHQPNQPQRTPRNTQLPSQKVQPGSSSLAVPTSLPAGEPQPALTPTRPTLQPAPPNP